MPNDECQIWVACGIIICKFFLQINYMNNNVIQEKSYIFALKSVQLYKFLITEQKEFVLSKQYLRSATSVGANVEEAIGGQTNKDFFCKMTIAYQRSS